MVHPSPSPSTETIPFNQSAVKKGCDFRQGIDQCHLCCEVKGRKRRNNHNLEKGEQYHSPEANTQHTKEQDSCNSPSVATASPYCSSPYIRLREIRRRPRGHSESTDRQRTPRRSVIWGIVLPADHPVETRDQSSTVYSSNACESILSRR